MSWPLLPHSLTAFLPGTVKALQMPAIYIGATQTKAGQTFSFHKNLVGVLVLTTLKNILL